MGASLLEDAILQGKRVALARHLAGPLLELGALACADAAVMVAGHTAITPRSASSLRLHTATGRCLTATGRCLTATGRCLTATSCSARSARRPLVWRPAAWTA